MAKKSLTEQDRASFKKIGQNPAISPKQAALIAKAGNEGKITPEVKQALRAFLEAGRKNAGEKLTTEHYQVQLIISINITSALSACLNATQII